MLFSNFSWQDFLLVAALLSVLWYVLVWLLFYRCPKDVDLSVVPRPEKGIAGREASDQGLMGISAAEPGSHVVSADDFGFAGADEELIGPVADAKQEIVLACRELEGELATKEMFLESFAAIIGSYPIPEQLKESMGEFVREHVPFFIAEDELARIGL